MRKEVAGDPDADARDRNSGSHSTMTVSVASGEISSCIVVLDIEAAKNVGGVETLAPVIAYKSIMEVHRRSAEGKDTLSETEPGRPVILCLAGGCEEPARVRGRCRRHYRQ